MTGDSRQDRLAALRSRLPAARSRLKALEIDLTVERARLSKLIGTSAAEWGVFRRSLATAWDASLAADECFAGADEATGGGDQLLEVPDSVLDSTEAALDRADAALDVAEDVVAKLRHAWDEQEPRVMDARAVAQAAGKDASRETAERADEIVSFADFLLGLLERDPLNWRESDVAVLEQWAQHVHDIQRDDLRNASRFRIELLRTKAEWRELTGHVEQSRKRFGYARDRIAGLPQDDPVSDAALTDLERRLNTIGVAADVAPLEEAVPLAADLANDLAEWRSDFEAVRQAWEDALANVDEAIQRRDTLRGLWKALRAKASARGLDEDLETGDALSMIQQRLWTAPLDLDAAETALTRLAQLIEGHGQGRINDERNR